MERLRGMGALQGRWGWRGEHSRSGGDLGSMIVWRPSACLKAGTCGRSITTPWTADLAARSPPPFRPQAERVAGGAEQPVPYALSGEADLAGERGVPSASGGGGGGSSLGGCR